MLDSTNPKAAHFDRRLHENIIIWLAEVRPDGRPHMSAVWFLWDGQHITIFSQPSSQKVKNIPHNPRVMLALDNTFDGGDVDMLEGEATLFDQSEATVETLHGYAEKYADELREMGSTPADMAKSYSIGIRIRPTKFYLNLVAEE